MPEDYPPGLSATTMSSTSIKLIWSFLTADLRANGIIVGYSIRYMVKGTSPPLWMYKNIIGSQIRIDTINSLKKYAIYEFCVAAKTSVGTGVYSPAVEKRTDEDGRYHPIDSSGNVKAWRFSSQIKLL